MAAPSPRDPWWVPAPLEGAPVARRAAICVAPDGLAVTAEVAAAVRDAGSRLEAAGWTVEEVAAPPLAEAAELQARLWIGESYAAMRPAAEADGDPGLLALLDNLAPRFEASTPDAVPAALRRRATLIRDWSLFLTRYAVLVLPVSAEPPFPDNLDRENAAAFERVWRAQMPMIGLPLLGLPALSVATGLAASGASLGVQVVAARFREDLCLDAGVAIEAGGVPPAPIDPKL